MGLHKDLEYLTHNVGLLLSAGVDVASALGSIESGVKSTRVKKALQRMRTELAEGDSLSNVFERSGLFPERVILLIRMGENSGQLTAQFKMISVQEEKQRALRTKLRSALLYPAFVFSVTLFVGVSVSWFILPRLARVFIQLKLELPLLTKVILGFGAFLGDYGAIFVPSMIIGIIVATYTIFIYEKTRWIGEKILFAIPGVHRFIQEIELTRLGVLLGGLLQGGVPILDALQSLQSATQSRRYQKLYAHVFARIAEGDSIADAFASFRSVEDLVPAPVQQIIVVGSESGRLAEVLLKIGAVYEEKSETSTRNLSVILEPVLLVIVWAAVVSVALGVIMPMYNLIGGINR